MGARSVLRMLVVGDDTVDGRGLCRILHDLPGPVEIERIEDAAFLASVFGDVRFDLVFVGVLPMGADPAEAVRAVRAQARDTPIAVVAQHETPSAVRSAIAAGAAGYIPTLSSPASVLQAVKLVLSGSAYVPASMLSTVAADPPALTVVPRLTRRQKAVLHQLAKGLSNKQIALAMDLSEATVKVHIAAIMRALKVENRTQAVLTARQTGFLFEEKPPDRGYRTRPPDDD